MVSRKRVFVTTSHGAGKDHKEKAKAFASEHGYDYVSRQKIEDISRLANDAYVYVFSKNRILSVFHEGTELFFHPSVAKIRMLNIQHGQPDHLISSLSLDSTTTVLDTTLGLGTEALLIAAFLESGSVTALEKSEHVYNVVRIGLEYYPYRNRWMVEAASRIKLVRSSYKEYFADREDASYDVVYCDPMFEKPKMRSSSINALRPFASSHPPSESDIVQMKRIARKRVVFKVRETDRLFETLLSIGFEYERRTSNDIFFLVAENT